MKAIWNTTLMKHFFMWFWFRKDYAYKRKRYPLKIIRVYTWRTFLLENYINIGSRMTVQKIMPWEGWYKRPD